MDISLLVKLTARAWCLEILSALHSGVPGRQAPLLASIEAGRTAFAQSMGHLVELGVLERNPGYGHPLRPEFRLTAVGRHMAMAAHEIVGMVADPKASGLLRRNWTVPVLAVTCQPKRFNQMKVSLGTITDRALSQSLEHLQDQGWLARDVDLDARPPFSLYRAANTGLMIGTAARKGVTAVSS
jgi:DNA-binding HxlR family transcriptional regulator